MSETKRTLSEAEQTMSEAETSPMGRRVKVMAAYAGILYKSLRHSGISPELAEQIVSNWMSVYIQSEFA